MIEKSCATCQGKGCLSEILQWMSIRNYTDIEKRIKLGMKAHESYAKSKKKQTTLNLPGVSKFE